MTKDISDKLTYEDLKIGEKSVDLYKAGASIEEIQKNSAIYLNTQPFFGPLNVTDAVTANILMGGNGLLTGRYGCGKSQLAQDYANYYFGGVVDAGGQALIIQGDPNLDIIQDVFTTLNKTTLKRELNDNVNAHYANLEEINRCPPFSQNQFFTALNGRIIYGGDKKSIGKGYCPTLSTANFGNGEYKGTFESDSAMLNRFGIVINLDEPEFKPTFEDRRYLDKIRPADSRIKESPIRDLTSKLLIANQEIKSSSLDLGVNAEAVLEFLRESLDNCSKSPVYMKDLEWGVQNSLCQKCELNKKAPSEYALCSMIQSPVPRTLNNTRLYVAALDYLIKLKGQENSDSVDLVFKAFELTGPYQGTLNPFIANSSKFNNKNSAMIKEVVKKLKEDYRKNEDRILSTLSMSKEGKTSLFYFFSNDKKDEEGNLLKEISWGYNALPEKARKGLESLGTVEPFEFNDKGILGYSWVEKSSEFNANEFEKNKNLPKESDSTTKENTAEEN